MESQHRQRHDPVGLPTQLWRIAKGILALSFLYDLLARPINHLDMLIAGGDATEDEIVEGGELLPQLYTLDLDFAHGLCDYFTSPEICAVIRVCVVAGVLTLIIFEWICRQEWVQEEVEIEECWEEVVWYNPWSWGKAIVCSVVEIVKWVLKQICEWRKTIIVVAIIVCIGVGIAAVA